MSISKKKNYLCKKKLMDKLTKTIITYLSSIALQVLCFFMGRNSQEEYRSWFKRILSIKQNFNPSTEWFTIVDWKGFDFVYYDSAELTAFIALFSITALSYISFSGENIRKNYPLLRVIPFIFSLLSGYVILYEIIALFC